MGRACAAAILLLAAAIPAVPAAATTVTPTVGHYVGTVEMPLGPSHAYFEITGRGHQPLHVHEFHCCGQVHVHVGHVLDRTVHLLAAGVVLDGRFHDAHHVVGEGRIWLWGAYVHVTWRAHWLRA